MDILVINSGSSSIKFSIIDSSSETVVSSGIVEGIGEAAGQLRHRKGDADPDYLEFDGSIDHRRALDAVFSLVSSSRSVDAIGHRVVHGGDRYRQPVLVDRALLDTLAGLDALAPLHNPANRLGITMAMELLPDVPQVAVFDTAFHRTLPDHAFRYAVPEDWYREHGVRRYGFHGISHQFVTEEAARFLGRPADSLNLISLHLGNGASVAAVQGGRCVDTSMGMTPLEGLVMGTRPGDLDPGVILQLVQSGIDPGSLENTLNHDSGLRGLCGENDMRRICRRAGSGDAAARLAIDVFSHRLKKYIGAYTAALGRLDVLAFTAGIGENSAEIRERALSDLQHLGIELDPSKNRSHDSTTTHAIHRQRSAVSVLIVPNGEDRQIARAVRNLLKDGP